MLPSLLRASGTFRPAESLQLAQQAPAVLDGNPKEFSRSPLTSLFAARESAEIWVVYENLLLSCLRTGDDTSAHECLERLVRRFGNANERIVALKGLVKEAQAVNDAALAGVLKEYEAILAENHANIPIAKRRVVVLRSLGRVPDAIAALTALLDTSPTDAEAWSELAELYLSQGLYAQAIFALEEVLVLNPYAWNMHARFGEILLMAATTASSEDGATGSRLAEALRRFCRSVELCSNYLRGYYGLKMVSDRLLDSPGGAADKRSDADSSATAPDRPTLEKLNQRATEKLAEIVRRYGAGETQWQGYEEEEVAAARMLLDETSAVLAR